MLNNIILFIIIFVIVFFIYEWIIYRDLKKRLKNKRKNTKTTDKYPMEVKILVDFYKLKLDNINYNRLIHIICIVSSLDISLIVIISGMFDKGYMQILVAFLIVLPIIFFSYYLIVFFYKFKEKRRNK